MPFLKEYGLATYPFGLTPNTNLYYPSAETEGMLTGMEFALSRGDGLMKIVGEVGSGKTLISRMLLSKLPKKSYNTAYINAPINLSASQIPDMLVKEFGIRAKKTDDSAELLREYLLKEHGKGKRNVLILDEAQALGEVGLEAVRLLTNLETETDKLLQIVLFGQSELDKLLKKKTMRQIQQRIGFSFDMPTFKAETVFGYIHHRLKKSGVKARNGHVKKGMPKVSFTKNSCMMIAKLSRGVPRIIHMLSDKSIIAAYAEGAHEVRARHVRAAMKETYGLPLGWRIFYSISL